MSRQRRMPDGRIFHDVFHVKGRGFFKRGHRQRLSHLEISDDTGGLSATGLSTRMSRGMTAAEAYNAPRAGKRLSPQACAAYLGWFRPWLSPEEAPPAEEVEEALPNGHATETAPAPAAVLPAGTVEVRLVTLDPVRFAELVNSIGAIRELLEELVERAGPRRRP